jgi:hypothetical protein
LQPAAVNSNKLIKINKSKKILETARRSRIQQLDSDNYNSQGAASLGDLNALPPNNNAPPSQYHGDQNSHLLNSATTKSAKANKLESLSASKSNFKNSYLSNTAQRL